MTSPRPTEDPSSRLLATKTRIITHMNADHANSLSLFLQHYCNMPAHLTTSPKLIDITCSQLIISTSATTHNIIIPLKPPMESLSNARERMVSMHAASLEGLGLSGTRVEKWVFPREVWQWGLTILATVSYVTFPFPQWVTPEVGGLFYQMWSVGGRVPGLAWLVNKLAVYALAFMLVAHGIEMRVMATGRLRRHHVESGSRVWWAWIGNVFLSGVAALDRFDGLVVDVEREKTRKSEKAGGH